MVGSAFTRPFFLTIRHFDSDEALDTGPIGRITDVDDLERFIRSYCMTIFNNAPPTLHTLDRTVAPCFDSRDFVEGRRAFRGI